MNALTRQLIRASLPAQRAILRRRLGRVVIEDVDGISLVVLPKVFNGVVFRSGVYLARQFENLVKAYPSLTATRVLEMGTGSGIGAMFAARAGCMVTAVDINPDAVRCAQINALLNRLEARVNVLEGDLFEPIAGQTFDYVLFNPPFYRGTPKDELDKAWRAESVIERFAEGLPAVLSPGGQAFVIYSSHADVSGLLSGLERSGLNVEMHSQHDYGTEVNTIFRVERSL